MCGFVTLRSDRPDEQEYLARVAALKGIVGRISPMRPLPLVTGPTTAVMARWGWPSSKGGILTHARSETAPRLPTWADAWRQARGVIPVAGWEEGSWAVTAPRAHLAVLWTHHDDDIRLAILTQPPPASMAQFERFPIPLTQEGALTWLAEGSLVDQVVDLHLTGTGGQTSLFDH